jgi:hypothetical protein
MKDYYDSGKTSLNLAVCTQLASTLRGLYLPKPLIPALEKQNLIKATFFALILEGHSDLNWSIFQSLLTSSRLPQTPSEQLARNYFTLLKNIPQLSGQKLTLTILTNFHRDLSAHLNDHPKQPLTTNPSLKTDLTDLLTWIKEDTDTNPFLMAGVVYKQIIELRPFITHLGLIARALSSLVLIRSGEHPNRQWVLDDFFNLNATEYTKQIKLESRGDYAIWLNYFIRAVRFSLQLSLDTTTAFANTICDSKKLTGKEKEVWTKLQTNPIPQNLAELATSLHLSKQRTHLILQSLENKQCCLRLGSGKKIIYTDGWRTWSK